MATSLTLLVLATVFTVLSFCVSAFMGGRLGGGGARVVRARDGGSVRSPTVGAAGGSMFGGAWLRSFSG
jgi:uncharacterized membrane protein